MNEPMNAITIVDASVHDVRFPTSDDLAGSDAMHAAPDYSTSYVRLTTDVDGLCGYGSTFTIGRGADIVTRMVAQLADDLVGRRIDDMVAFMAELLADLTQDGSLRWLGPEKGVIHLAAAAVLNAVWDPLGQGAPRAPVATPGGTRARGTRGLSDPSPSGRRAHRRRGRHDAAQAPWRSRRADRTPAPARLSRVHILGRLVGLQRQPGPTTRLRSAGRGVERIQAQGWRESRRRPAAHADGTRTHRQRPLSDGGCQPGMGGSRGNRVDQRSPRGRSPLDRGADKPRRHPRARRHRAGGGAGSGLQPGSTPTIA